VRSFAASSIASSLSRKLQACAIKRFESHQCRCHAEGLGCFSRRILIVLGGKDKGSDYTLLQRPLREKAILALLMARRRKNRKQIAGSVAIERAGTIERAVEIASHAARSGDVVLLAPACASFDQFQNYEHRGRVFKELVRQWSGRRRVQLLQEGE